MNKNKNWIRVIIDAKTDTPLSSFDFDELMIWFTQKTGATPSSITQQRICRCSKCYTEKPVSLSK